MKTVLIYYYSFCSGHGVDIRGYHHPLSRWQCNADVDRSVENISFTTFPVPGIILTVFVGGSSLVAFVLNLRNTLRRYEWAILAGVMTCGWVLVQMLLINTIFWLQFVYLGIGIVMMLIAYQLKGKALI